MKVPPSVARTAAIARKEGLHILRDVRSLLMALAVPVLMLLLFGYALTLDVDRIPTLVLDRDQTSKSRELVELLNGSRYFDVRGYVEDYRTIEEEMDRGRCLLGVVIGAGYGSDLLASRPARVQVILDGSDSNTASIALSYVHGLVRAYNLRLRVEELERKGGGRLEPPVDAQLRVWYNSQLRSRNYIVPGLIAIILIIIAALLTSLTIAREWENGSMEQLLSTPVRPHEIVLGKMAAYFVLGFINTLVTMATGVFLFDVPLRGSPLLVLLTSSIFLIGGLFWGILLSALTRNQLYAYQAAMLTSFLPAFLLSGFIFAIQNMPAVIQLITYLFPSRYFISILKGLFLKGVGLEILWGEVLLLLLYAAVVFVLATRKLSRGMG